MPNTYVLVEGESVQTGWYQLIESLDFINKMKLEDQFVQNTGKHMLAGRSGLNLNNIGRFATGFLGNLERYLSNGKTILINRVGGFRFLEEGMKVLSRVESDFMPNETGAGLSGWLAPDGEFHPCLHGQHYAFAMEMEERLHFSEEDQLLKFQYAPMGSVGHSFDKLSHLHVPHVGWTSEQLAWFESHYEFLDPYQKKIFDGSVKRG